MVARNDFLVLFIQEIDRHQYGWEGNDHVSVCVVVCCPAPLVSSPHLADLVRSQSIGKPIDCCNSARCHYWRRHDGALRGGMIKAYAIRAALQQDAWNHTQALGIVRVGVR